MAKGPGDRRTRLLVVIDPTSELQIALVKALLIAKLGNCHIHALLCVHEDFGKRRSSASQRDIRQDILAEAREWLERELEPCRIAGVPCDVHVVWNRRWVETVMHAVARVDCDLLIKSTFEHSRAGRFFRKTSDFTLMRYCACPILFTGEAQEWKSDRIVACLDLESADPQHMRLNHVVLRDARAFGEIVGMDLYVASAHDAPLLGDHLPLDTGEKPVDAEALGALYRLEPGRIILRQGPTVDTLAAICDEIDPSIVVLGTLARTGVSGKLIGNTAEKLLDRVAADILTVN